jgi:hypothetical protein
MTHNMVVKDAETLQNLCNDGGPRGYITSLNIGFQLIEVANDHEAKPAIPKISFLSPKASKTHNISRLEASSLFFACSGRLSEAIRSKTLTRVAALLDSCFKRLGGCLINPVLE